ncbi:MAG: glycosyltransferase [Lachnospiraceae bacterium]|nr:glycosyltransferase [Lachnospiraceae bacterium]
MFKVNRFITLVKKAVNQLHDKGISYVLLKIQQNKYDNAIISLYKNSLKSDGDSSIDVDFVNNNGYLVSVIVPLYNTDKVFLKEMVDSVIEQSYKKFELCLADASDDEHSYVGEYCLSVAEKDSRVKYIKLDENLGISENTNKAIIDSSGDYIALLDHDDLLHKDALLYVMSKAINEEADFVYTDEVKFCDSKDNIISVNYKPDFAIDNLFALNYICHFVMFKKDLLDTTGLINSNYDGAQDHDFFLRLVTNANKVRHVDKVLYYWRYHKLSTSSDIYSKQYAIDAGKNAVRDNLLRLGYKSEVNSTSAYPTVYKIDYYNEQIEKENIKTDIVVIGKRADNEYIKSNTDYGNINIYQADSIKDIYNIDTDAEYVCILNDNIYFKEKDWLRKLLTYAIRSDTGCIGAMILRKNKVKNFGYKIDNNDIVPVFKGLSCMSTIDTGRLFYAQETMLVPADCMVISYEQFLRYKDKICEYDKEYMDFELSLNLFKDGYNNIINPYARVCCKSIDDNIHSNKQDKERLIKRWESVIKSKDVFFSRV